MPFKQKHLAISAYATMIIVTTIIIAKTIAYGASGSTSLLSTLMDSIMDSLISLMALASIYYANRPADEDHRWGHGKMEAVSALFQSAIIAAGGAFIVFESVNRLIRPTAVENHMLGIGVIILSMILSAILVTIQKHSLKNKESLALEADSAHYSSDIFVNGGVLIVLILGYIGAPYWIDPVFAFFVALYLGSISKTIGSKAVDMLMDRELPTAERQSLINIIEAHKAVTSWHDLRTHKHGDREIISFDIEADGELSLHKAHDIAKDLENEMLKIFPKAEILIHIDPEGYTDDARHRVAGVHT